MYSRYVATWSSHDVEKMTSYFTDDCLYENLATGNVYRGKDELKAWALMTFEQFPGFKLEMTTVFVSGNWIGGEWVFTGTHMGDAPSLPATGKTVSIRGSAIAGLVDGKIRREAIYWNSMTFLRQLGAIQ